MAKRYPKEIKEEVLRKIREGQRVSEIANALGIINDRYSRTGEYFRAMVGYLGLPPLTGINALIIFLPTR